MRSMSVAGFLAILIVGGLVLDHLWIVAGIAVAVVLVYACYLNGKSHQ